MAKKDPKPIDYSKPLKKGSYERYCQEFIVDNNRPKAAIRAGYSEKYANTQAHRLSTNVDIQGRTAYLQAKLSEASGVTAQMLMEEWKKIGFANVKNIVNRDHTIKDISSMPDDVAAGISSVSTTKNGTKITMHSKETALENMGKHIGFYLEDNSQKQTSLADFLKAFKDE